MSVVVRRSGRSLVGVGAWLTLSLAACVGCSGAVDVSGFDDNGEAGADATNEGGAVDALSDDSGSVSDDSGSVSDDSGAVSDDSGAVSDDSGSMSGDSGSVSGDSGSMSGDSGSVSGDSGSMSGDSGSMSGDSGSGGMDSGTTGMDSGTTGMDSGSDSGVVCPAPTAGAVYVSPTGSDTTGNGSATCPFVTITKALSTTIGATSATTIHLAPGTAASPNVYGSGCTAGAGKCDATPIHVSDGMSGGIVISGDSSDPNAVTVVGGTAATDTAVFTVSPANVGFQNLTIAPKHLATNPSGGRVAGAAGIRFSAPAVKSGSEASVTNVIVLGTVHSNSSESTGPGIEISGGTSPTIGPAVTIVGGDHSVLVTQSASGTPATASAPTITSSDAGPSFFHSGWLSCIRVESTNAAATAFPTARIAATSTSDPGRLHLQDCSGNGAIVVDLVKRGTTPVSVTDTLIDASSAGTLASYGIRVQHAGALTASTAVTITGLNAGASSVSASTAAISIEDTGAFGVSAPPVSGVAGLVVTGNHETGVHITGNAVADINDLTSTNNGSLKTHHGLFCDATPASGAGINIFLRSSTFLGNLGHGVFIAGKPGGLTSGCAADLGNASSGGNVFNKTSQKNGVLGVCYTSNYKTNASGDTWSCGLMSGAACVSGMLPSPMPVVSTGCDTAGDYNSQTLYGMTVAAPITCCGM